jgi:hypothetical protein
MSDLLTTLLTKLDESTAAHTENDLYYTGRQPLAFLSPAMRRKRWEPGSGGWLPTFRAWPSPLCPSGSG